MDRPAKRPKLLSDDESGDDQGVAVQPAKTKASVNGFKVNEEYAQRFEHNKKREEKDRLEEKYGKDSHTSNRKRGRDDADDSEDTEEDESEDDEAELVTEDVDKEIFATLNAIKSRDPRVYDQNVKFYRDFEPEVEDEVAMVQKKEKPMYLQDYHRQNLLAGHTGEDEGIEPAPPRTYQQEQDAMKRELVGAMHATANGSKAASSDDEDDDDLLVAKSKPKHSILPIPQPQPKPQQITETDIARADKDPETYLSNFMASRAWLPTSSGNGTTHFQAFDSDDSEEEKRAEQFEEAYNMRFEDPKTANEKLQSFARDVGKYSVRRESEKKGARQRARDREKEEREARRREREEEKARLRRLKIEEAEGKVRRIREAAGLRGKEVSIEEWRDVIEGDFDDAEWEEVMRRRFGEEYYAAPDGFGGDDDEGSGARQKKSKVKKPKWEDDIDIKDLVPEFDEEESKKAAFTLSAEDEEEDEEGSEDEGGVPVDPSASDDSETAHPSKKRKKTRKDRTREKADSKRRSRLERRQIESLVDTTTLPLALTNPTSGTGTGAGVGFRYRETSPTTFGLSARDILFADDTQLNQYAGLKKLTGWREEEKKKRDRKKFSKKQRLREWRREVFGRAEEPVGGFERMLGVEEKGGDVDKGGVREGERRKKRKRGKKLGNVEE